MRVIDEYLVGLDRRLAGPRRRKADLLTEARHSLLDAAEAYAARGLAEPAAARRAVAEFGTYPQVVPGYQRELTVAQGRRTAGLFAVGLPLLDLLAPLMWRDSPWAGAVRDPGYFLLAGAFDLFALIGAGLAALVWLGFGRGARFAPDGPVLARRLGVASLVYLVVYAAGGGLIFGWSVAQWPRTMTWPPVLIGLLVMNLMITLSGRSAWRCLRLSWLEHR